ncbi:SagB/ThcOx family dehydrogenase [Streptococcus orisasini]|uniref:SagB/ThcOx family dehydrogenase n=1 Tax=Streptococcus orisasini TaxID=1080071 RepID=UPI00070B4564|nr:SagB/ThcOx family dehydrogenase [Streptococcus orisasini]
MNQNLWNFERDTADFTSLIHKNSVMYLSNKSVKISKKSRKKNWEYRPSIELYRTNENNFLEELLLNRRTIREPSGKAITLTELSRLLEFGCGISDKMNLYFTYPSPGATYATTIFIYTTIRDLNSDMLYRYNPYSHSLEEYESIDNDTVKEVIQDDKLDLFPIYIFFATDFQLIQPKYGTLTYRLLNQEVGHIAQNLSLQAVAMGLNSTIYGGFYEEYFLKLFCEKKYNLLSVMFVG